MENLTNKKFWENAFARAVRTFAQAMLSSLAVGNTITSFDWPTIISISLTATLMSLLTSVVLGVPEAEE